MHREFSGDVKRKARKLVLHTLKSHSRTDWMFGKLKRKCQHQIGYWSRSCWRTLDRLQWEHVFFSIRDQGWQASMSIPQVIQLLIFLVTQFSNLHLGSHSRLGPGVQFRVTVFWVLNIYDCGQIYTQPCTTTDHWFGVTLDTTMLIVSDP